jgi:hypothetical protein
MHKRQRAFAMAKKVGGGVMKIPRVHVNHVSMLKIINKCDYLGTKLFQLQMFKIVSHVSWILETKNLRIGMLSKSSMHKQTPNFAMRYVCQYES